MRWHAELLVALGLVTACGTDAGDGGDASDAGDASDGGDAQQFTPDCTLCTHFADCYTGNVPGYGFAPGPPTGPETCTVAVNAHPPTSATIDCEASRVCVDAWGCFTASDVDGSVVLLSEVGATRFDCTIHW